ncbi:cupin domain-containing protein [Micromonospora sp. NPDC049282]|uniref:cupin domain-containing protein n=1 Tax=Micromonospora sp. NPDC049282 TaxID=3364269 RepID=UPI003718DDB5
MTTPATSQATLVRAGDAEMLDADPTSVITLLADPEHTGERLTSNRSLLKQGTDGAPPHLHKHSAEMFFILDGSLQMLIGNEVTVLNKDDFLVVPPGTPHAFAPAPGCDADVLVVLTPGRERFEYYRLLDRAHRGEATWAEVAATGDRFDNHYVDSPAWREARATA